MMIKALFVDDNSTLCRFASVSLKHAIDDLEVMVASTMREANELAQHSKIDGLIVDRHLVDGDGLELMARVRENQGSCFCIVISADSLERWSKEALDAGADATLEKPFDTNELVSVTKKLIRAHAIK